MVNKFFVSAAEANFFRVLRKVVGDQGYVLAQVPLGQLLYFPGQRRGNSARASWRNRATARIIDFVICHPATLKPLVAIELDEPTHARPDRQTRDESVERLLAAANFPLLRLLTERAYDTRELTAALAPYIASRPQV